jgi:hypothetical protein
LKKSTLYFRQILTSTYKLIASSINIFIKPHSKQGRRGCVRKKSQQNTTDAVTLAACWNLKNGSNVNQKVARTLGVSKHLIDKNVAMAANLKRQGRHFQILKRKKRNDCMEKEVFECIQRWRHRDDEATRIDTNSYQVHKLKTPTQTRNMSALDESGMS